MNVGNVNQIRAFARQIVQDAKDAKRDLAAGDDISALLASIERGASLAEAGCDAVAESLREVIQGA
jgi:hypothetical protein